MGAVAISGLLAVLFASFPSSVARAQSCIDTCPTLTVSNPTSGSSFVFGQVAFTGVASDPTGIDTVGLQIMDNTTGLFLQGDDSWDSVPYFSNGSVLSPGPGYPSVSWTQLVWTTLPASNYTGTVQATDAAPNFDATTVTSLITVLTTDATAPVVSIASPTPNQNFASAPFTISGAASDNVGVKTVKYGVEQLATKLWLMGDGVTWGSSQGNTFLFPATLSAPGSPSTTWSHTFSSMPSGAYMLQVQAVDSSGNRSSNATQSFTVGTLDTTNPTQSQPVITGGGGQAPAFSGSSSDDVAVSRVNTSIKDASTGNWLQ